MNTRPNHLRMRIKMLAADARAMRNEELRLVGRSKPGELTGELAPIPAGAPPARTARTRVGGSIRYLRSHQGDPKLVKALEDDYANIHWDRVIGHRRSLRSAQLAYGFLRGQPYRKIEGPTTREMPPEIIPGVIQQVMKWRPVTVSYVRTKREVEAWLAVPAVERVTL
jgi:hypothetical protein